MMKQQLTRVLVTGGAGFIGSHTVDYLLALGKEVVVLDNLSSGKLGHLDRQHRALTFIEGDILSYPTMASLVADCDAVLHLAAIASVPHSIENPLYTFQVNTQGLLHVLQAVNKVNPTARVVYASSAAVYGDAERLPCCDETPSASELLSPYAMQKKHDEDYAQMYAKLFGVKSLGLRYFNVYGSRQDPHSPYSGVISHFVKAYHQGEPLIIHGDGLQSRDFIHVSDVAKANVQALMSDYVGVMNIATGVPKNLLEVIEAIESAGNKTAEREHAAPRQGDIRLSYGTIAKAMACIGFKYGVSLVDGMRELVLCQQFPREARELLSC